MKHRQFGQCGFEVSALGFGCMRLPCVGGDQSVIREDEAARMIRYAIDEGVNYVDTAYGYHGGNSEKFVGKVLADGYRDRVKLATKLPVWLCKSPDDFGRLLSEQLERLATDHIDCYLLHSLNRRLWANVRDMGVLDFLAKAPAAREAHPRTEHWAPLYVALGAAAGGGSLANRSVIDGFWYGLSKRSWQLG